ncbi:leucine-rich repeat and calponin homology domain-containing protein isoform X2 [Lepeophtheirus salmonis]|uniref:leucine-rich repeat and calponin homology domain-containing protein isoform X2 n=1 Tax=Lepeophtheirus salmonis TaxID=72036 RepID=UPI001AE13CA0|nr:leucine-rich repeat and calponin homology domain-containing protein 1-like isoform X2 [Lepeophtheirus salmonis]
MMMALSVAASSSPTPPPASHHSQHPDGKGGVILASSLSLSLEKLLDQAETSGELKLSGRNLKSFPRAGPSKSYNYLRDTVVADLSRNKLNEVPDECTKFSSMEKFLLYHNTIKSIPDSIIALHSLQFLDLSRNQLSYLPANLCQLPLQGLIVNNNRLVSLPEEIGKMQTLMELDASCNEIAHLPVQIGDLSSLKCLKLRRNHLQEIPVEISYLQLSTLDLSGNRISILPVELRFMTSVIDINLEENPLTCPPANLCSRGRIHIYKYLEIQAIKEDRRRGVLTDSEYRRSFRKTGTNQLSDMGFNNMFNCDPRRKRNTADSGYGSEQPLERRWSQDFNQEIQDYHPDEAKRLILKAASSSTISRSINKVSHVEKKVPPHTSSGSSTASSGYSSLCGPHWENGGMSNNVLNLGQNPLDCDYKNPSIAGSISSSQYYHSPNSVEGSYHKMMDGMTISNERNHNKPTGDFVDSTSQERSVYGHNSSVKRGGDKGATTHLPNHPTLSRPNPASSSSKLSSPRHNPPNPPLSTHESKILPHSSSTTTTTTTNVSSSNISIISNKYSGMVSPPNKINGSSGLPLPSKLTRSSDPHTKVHSQTYRQYKEQLRQQRNNGSNHDYSNSNEIPPPLSEEQQSNDIKSRLSSHPHNHITHGHGNTMKLGKHNGTSSSFAYSYDVKTMQKEAVLSFVKSKSNGSSNTVNSSKLPSSSGIPQPSLNSSSRLKMPQHSNTTTTIDQNRTFTARREAEKSATSETHIQQLKMHLENRLRLTLPDDISGSLVDGVILCHMANHVKPRSVPSIHVPSPAVPKLTSAKCRKNVENFLLACRKIGVRDDLICSPSDVLEPRKQGTVRIAISISELLRFQQPKMTMMMMMANGN